MSTKGPGAITRGPILAHNSLSLTGQIPMAVAQPFPNSNHAEPPFKLTQQPMMKNSLSGSGQSFRQAQVGQPYPVIRATPSTSPKEPRLRSDLQGVVLTLGGPGSSKGSGP